MVWTESGKIFLANYQVSSTSHDDIDTVPGAGGRSMVAGFDVASDSSTFFKEGTLYNGYSRALVYKNYCASCPNLFIGGSIYANGSWQLLITRLTETGV